MTMQNDTQKDLRFSTTVGQLLLLGAAVIVLIVPGATYSKTPMRPTRLFAKKRTRKKTSAWISAKSNGRPQACP